MTAEELLINAQHQIKQLEEDCKDLQQENARLKEISWDWERKYFDLIKSTDKELKVLKQLMVLDHLRLKKLLKKQRR